MLVQTEMGSVAGMQAGRWPPPRAMSLESHRPGLATYSHAAVSQAFTPEVFFAHSALGQLRPGVPLLFSVQGQVLPLTCQYCGAGPRDTELGGPDFPSPFLCPQSWLCKLEGGHLGSRLHLCPAFSSLPPLSPFLFAFPSL